MIARFRDEFERYLEALGERDSLEAVGPGYEWQGLPESRFYEVSLPLEGCPPWWIRVGERFCSLSLVQESYLRQAGKLGKHLLELNSTRVLVDLRERLLESRRLLERGLIQGLERLQEQIEQAVFRAEQLREMGAERVTRRLELLESWEEELRRLREPKA